MRRRVAALCLWWLLVVAGVLDGAVMGVLAAIGGASVALGSLTAGAASDATVAFTSSIDVAVGSFIVVDFPTGFKVSASASLAVRAANSATTLAISSVTATQVVAAVQSTAIAADTAFEYVVSDVTNPATGDTTTFSIAIQDSSGAQIDAATGAAVTITGAAFSTASVTLDSTDAGVTGTAAVTFTTGVALPVGSVLVVAFPSVVSVASSSALSSLSSLDSASTVAVASTTVVKISIAGSALTAGTTASFKLDGVTNPGATTTGTFALVSADAAGNEYQYARAISGAVIVSTALPSVAMTPSSNLAGVETSYELSVQFAVAIPAGGYLTVEFPSDFTLANSLTLTDAVADVEVSGILDGAKVSFPVPLEYPAGLHTLSIGLVHNPGVSTTGSFSIITADANGFTLESGNCNGVAIVPGVIADAIFVPVLAHPGIVSRVGITFTTSSALFPDDFLHIQLPAGDYASGVLQLSVSVLTHVHVSATAVWDAQTTSMLILLTGSTSIASGSTVTVEVTALQMPPSVRAEYPSAVIQSWNSKGLQLDGPSSLILSAIAAVQNLPCAWVTSTAKPGIRSDVVVTFAVSGEVPAGGTIAIALPGSDFSAESAGNSPTVVFNNPASVTTTAMWSVNDNVLLITVESLIPAYTSSIEVKIEQLDTPPSVRKALRAPATLTTFDSVGIEIDGPSGIQLDAIVAGMVQGSRIWAPVNAVAGVTSNQRVSFSVNGRIDAGGSLEFVLLDLGWSLAATGLASFEAPALGAVGITAWDDLTRTLSVTLAANTVLPAFSQVSLLIPTVKNPPKEAGGNHVYLTTRAADGLTIDGPGVISTPGIARGDIRGAKTWTSLTTTSASMRSDQQLQITLSGALPSGSSIRVVLPNVGWRIEDAKTAVDVIFTLPASGVTASSATWNPAASELLIVTQGDLDEATKVELLIKDMVNPYAAEAAMTDSVVTSLADGGIVDESNDLAINAIVASDLPVVGTWTSAIDTPGVTAKQTISLQTGGRLDAGASICVAVQDDWEVIYGTAASIIVSDSSNTVTSPSTALSLSWTAATLCFQVPGTIQQESNVVIEVTSMRTPSAIRAERLVPVTITSHTGGNVNQGSLRVSPFVAGALSGPLTWQSAQYSPGPVAGMLTSARLAIQTTGRIPLGGQIQLTLQSSWTLPAACSAAFSQPALLSTASCSDRQLTISVMDDIAEQTSIEIVVSGIQNPDAIVPAESASCETLAPGGGGTIDRTDAVTIGAITCMLTDVASSGDRLVAVAGVTKKFSFVGSSVAANDFVKFVDASTTSDTNCGASTTGRSDAGGIDITQVGDTLGADLRFLHSSPTGMPFALCYKFGENPFKLYPGFSITVKVVESIAAIDGDANVAVVSHLKTWVVSGSGLASDDLIRWIDADVVDDPASVLSPPDCLDTTTLAELDPSEGGGDPDSYTRSTAMDGTSAHISLAFSEASRGKSYCLCYKFGDEPFVVYPALRVHVRHLVSIEAAGAVSSDSVAVVDATKAFNLVGDGMQLNDRLYFIRVGSALSCEASAVDPALRLTHTTIGQTGTLLFVDSTLSTTVNFTSSAAGVLAMPCYRFGNEPFHLYPTIQLEVKMVTAYNGPLGRASLAVADVPEPLTFLGFGVGEGDAVRWTRRDEEFCDTNLASLTALDTMSPVDTVVLDADASALFNFTTEQTDYMPILCYRFGNEPFQRYADISISIATLRGKTAAVGAKDVAVASARKTFVLSGVNAAPEDRVGWTFNLAVAEPCANLSLLLMPGNETTGSDATSIGTDYLSFTSARSSSTSAELSVAFAPINSGRRVYLCYGFGDEPMKLYSDLHLDVKSILNVRALLGSQAVAVAGEQKTFLFDGDGVASGDFAKFVTANDCSAPGVTLMNVMKEFDDIDDMAMYLYENGAGVTLGIFQFSASTDSAGLERTLCYRFGSEPYQNYNDFRIDIKTVWGITKHSATVSASSSATSDSVAVVNEPKLMAIDGVGVSAKDDLKFVDGAAYLSRSASDENALECESLPAQGLVGRELAVAGNLTSWFHFDYGSNGSSWLLCYKFAGERFRLYPSVHIIVKELTALLDFDFPEESNLGHVATIGHQKRWRIVGSGASAGDRAKFVAQNVLTSAECGVDDANVASGSAVMTVSSTSSATSPVLFFTGIFSEYPVTADEVYNLCYQFQDEPFSLIAGFSLKTYGLMGVDRTVALVDAAMAFQVAGLRLSSTDQLSWTTSAASCSTMVLDAAPVSDLFTVSLLFLKSYTKLYLCYSFDRQPFDIFQSTTLTVVNADVWIPLSIAIVADQTTQIDVAGTFGITDSSDQIAWIPSDSLSCSSDVISAYSSIMISSILSVAKASQASAPLAGSASFSVRYAAQSSSSSSSTRSALSTWKLCYRFGAMTNYLMFGDVLVDVMNVDQVQLRRRSASSVGSVLAFQFGGQGLRDFDTAKWVTAQDAGSDTDCESLPPVGGSAASNVINQRATFTFTEQSVGAMALCYQFQGRAYKLFANVPVVDSSSPTASSSVSSRSSSSGTNSAIAGVADEQAAVSSEQITVNHDVATVKLTLDKDIAEIPPGSAAETAFKAAFVEALALSLGIDTARIRITALIAGSVIVEFELAPSSSAGDPIVSEIVDELQAQVLDPSSALRSSAAADIVLKDPPIAALSVTISTATPSAAPESSMTIEALGYQRNGLFSFVKSIYSVTEKSGSVSIPIIREQGVGGDNSITLMVQLQAGATATYGQDYRFASSLVVCESTGDAPESLFLRFEPGDVVKEIMVEILDDDNKEAHFEAFTLVLVAPETPSAALGDTKATTVRIYDYNEGSPLGAWQFSIDNVKGDRLLGWQVVENGDVDNGSDKTLNNKMSVDANGAFAVDAVVGEREYDQECDLAAPTGECAFACEMGAGLKTIADVNTAHRALRLDGDDYVASTRGIDAFPSTAFTVSLWVRTSQTDPNVCLLSYAASPLSSTTPWAAPLTLCNPSSLELSINAGSRTRALSTFVNVSDGAWHFLALTWNADDGRVVLFDNGMLVFSGGPYRTGSSLPQGGTLVLGQLVLSGSESDPPCSPSTNSGTTVELQDATSLTTAEVSSAGVTCRVADGASGFVGDVQHVHVWSRRLSRSELLKELSWPPTAASSNALVLGWNFDAANLDMAAGTVADFALKGQDLQYPGYIHCSGSNACVAAGIIPSVHGAFPCGSVYANVWHFAAPTSLVSKLPLAYGGRLQFRMLAPSSNGSPRARRGRLSVFSDGGATRMSLSLGSFALPGRKDWALYSAVLREDFAWIDEPTGEPLERGEFRRRLAAASALWIRGDLWGHATDGSGALGQEVVYLNDVALFAR